ncbi:hypothetical protein BGZ74_003322, partial [Mortierella antarctica]
KPPQPAPQTPFLISKTAELALVSVERDGFSAKKDDEKKRTHTTHTGPDAGKKPRVGDRLADGPPKSTEVDPSAEAVLAAPSPSPPSSPSHMSPPPMMVDAPKSGAAPEELGGPFAVPKKDGEKELLDLVDYDEEQEMIDLPPEALSTLASKGDQTSAMDES